MSEPHKGCFLNDPATHSVGGGVASISVKHLYCQKLECSPDTQGRVQLVTGISSIRYQHFPILHINFKI